MRFCLCILILIAITGCAGSAGEVLHASPDELSQFDDWRLVHGYGYDWQMWGNKDPEIRQELTQRGTFTEEDWSIIDGRFIRQGKSKLLVMASWGPPTRVTSTVFGATTSETWEYSSYPHDARPVFVYIRNGVVTGWTEFKH